MTLAQFHQRDDGNCNARGKSSNTRLVCLSVVVVVVAVVVVVDIVVFVVVMVDVGHF